MSRDLATYRDVLTAVPWFAGCGEDEAPAGLGPPVRLVASWSEAATSCADATWEAATYRAADALVGDVTAHSRGAEWNESVDVVKSELIEPVLRPELAKFITADGLPQVVGDCVEWDVLHAALEEMYSAVTTSTFYRSLLRVYSAGRFPCGWDGPWPAGRLVIF